MLETLKKLCKLHAKNRRLIEIERELDAFISLQRETEHQRMIVNMLVRKYEEDYDDKLKGADKI